MLKEYQLNAVSWRSVSTCAVNHYHLPCCCLTSQLKPNVTFQPQKVKGCENKEGPEEEFCIAIHFSKQSRCEEPHQQPGGAYGSPQGVVQLPYSWFGVIQRWILHFSSLRLVILIITKHFPFWGKVTPSCLVGLLGIFWLCALSL